MSDDCRRTSGNLCGCTSTINDLHHSKVIYEYQDNYYKTDFSNMLYPMLISILPEGTILDWSGEVERDIPTGWLICEGGQFDPNTYPTLFKILGTNILPDCRGRVIITKDKDPNATKYKDVQEVGGEFVNTYSLTTIPNHRHWIVDDLTYRKHRCDNRGGRRPDYGGVKTVYTQTETTGKNKPFVVFEKTIFVTKIIKATPIMEQNRHVIPSENDPVNPRPPFVPVDPPPFDLPDPEIGGGIPYNAKDCHPEGSTKFKTYLDLDVISDTSGKIDNTTLIGGIEMELVEEVDEDDPKIIYEQYYVSKDFIIDKSYPNNKHLLANFTPFPTYGWTSPTDGSKPQPLTAYNIAVADEANGNIVPITNANRIQAGYEAKWYLEAINPYTSEWVEETDEDDPTKTYWEEETTYDTSKIQWELGVKYESNVLRNGSFINEKRLRGRSIVARSAPVDKNLFQCPPQTNTQTDWKVGGSYPTFTMWAENATDTTVGKIQFVGNAFQMDSYTPNP